MPNNFQVTQAMLYPTNVVEAPWNALQLVVSVFLIFYSACAAVRHLDSEVDSNLDSNGLCKTAKTWMDDCNHCWCPENGAPACTIKGCLTLPIVKVKEVIVINEEASK